MRKSAGLVVYRFQEALEVLLVHPGGPFYKNKDEGAWSIPKGEYTDEDPLEVAKKEFAEETGNQIEGNFIELEDNRLKSGKRISAWAVECDIKISFLKSNEFEIEWPPKSGVIASFPEVDRAEWFTVDEARKKLNPAQVNFIDQLEIILKNRL